MEAIAHCSCEGDTLCVYGSGVIVVSLFTKLGKLETCHHFSHV
jgi:hypothetical protein